MKTSSAQTTWEDGGAPLARMLKQVFVTLGFAWVNGDERVEISQLGDEFLASSTRDQMLSMQALRYQFWNPSVGTQAAHGSIRLHPVPFLARLFFTVGHEGVTNEEYNLFVARAKTVGDVERVADLIFEYRDLSPEIQKAIVDKCDSYYLGGAKRSSIYNTIALNRGYAYRMWTLSNLLEHPEGGRLQFVPKNYRGAERKFLEQYLSDGAYIDFASAKEFFTWMSDPASIPTKSAALQIYIERGDLEASILAQKALGATKHEMNKFERMMISEKTLEDNLEANLSVVGNAIKRNLTLVGRQFETTVGPIDLLTMDKAADRYVVIELKKGRSADRVFGQLSRYMGWVRANLADGKPVTGVIVASKIDDKLKAARAAHDTDVHLVRYKSQISAQLDD